MNGRQIELAISVSADAAKAQKQLRGVGDAAQSAADDIAQAGRQAEKASHSLDGVGESADTTASRTSQLAGAFGDVAGGLGLIGLGGFSDELEAAAPALMLVAGAADILSVATSTLSLANIKATASTIASKAATVAGSAATKAAALAQWALNAALTANPIGLVIAAVVALVAIFVVLVAKNKNVREAIINAWDKIKAAVSKIVDWFRTKPAEAWNKVRDAAVKAWATLREKTAAGFGAVRDTIQRVIGAVKDFVKGKVDAIVGFFGGLKGRISSKARSAFDGIKEAFKGVVNAIIGMWNSVDFGIHLTAPGWIPGLGGKGWNVDDIIPDIPYLASGGITTGPMLALIGDNPGGREAVIPLDKFDLMGGTTNITVNNTFTIQGAVDPVASARQVRSLLDAQDRRIGQLVAS